MSWPVKQRKKWEQKRESHGMTADVQISSFRSSLGCIFKKMNGMKIIS